MLEQGQVAVEERGMSKTEQSENKVIRRDLHKLFISHSGCIDDAPLDCLTIAVGRQDLGQG